MAVGQKVIDVFISYQHDSLDAARRIKRELEDEGWRVWLDESIPVGAIWENTIHSNLEAASSVLVLWTELATQSDWVLKEARYALSNGKLFGATLDEYPLPAEFGHVEVANLEDWVIDTVPQGLEWENLVRSLLSKVSPSDLEARRAGFDPNFLGDNIQTTFPSVYGEFERLDYTHFSVVTNRVRQLAWYVAYNVDMAQSRPEDRTRVGIRLDPQVALELQPRDEAFRDSGYDRGHLACRKSMMWGNETDARVAGKQAHFLTNTAPQNQIVNRRTYLAVEKWEMQFSAENGPLSVFCGPIFGARSPAFDKRVFVEEGIKSIRAYPIPEAFWKIVLHRVVDRLEQAAFVFENPARGERPQIYSGDPQAYALPIEELVHQLPQIQFADEILSAPAIF